jgi:glycosyltransferase involved in cell wall biosynthesis
VKNKSHNKVSIIILTKNEEKDIYECLRSVSWSDDIHVYDSFSTDNTVKIASEFGARVTQRAFDNWSSHQNWGLRNIRFKHKWVFYIDADERMTPELAIALQDAIPPTDHKVVAFQVQRRDFFMGRWLRHVQTTSSYLRLFRPEKMYYERLVNPVSIPDGKVEQLSGFIDHFPFSKGIGHWISRHNEYSRLEAEQIIENLKNKEKYSITKAIIGKDFQTRRYHQKEIFYRMPFRPLLKFVILYIGKRGFLDGRAGLTYATLQSIYEYFIILKVQEISIKNPL